MERLVCYRLVEREVLDSQHGRQGIIDDSIQGHLPRLRDNRLNRRHPVRRPLAQEIHQDKQQQFPVRTANRMKPTPPFVEASEASERLDSKVLQHSSDSP